MTVLASPAACSTPGDKLSYQRPPDATEEEAPADEEQLQCPHQGPPVIDVSGFEPCPQCGGGHCLLTSLLPPDKAANFDDCDQDSKCVSDIVLETKG